MARSFTVEQRRRRIAERHALTARRTSPEAAADAMVVLHASDPATIFLSALVRLETPSIEAMLHAMYGERTLVRQLAMRRTLFVASREVLPTIEASSSRAVAAAERKRLEGYLRDTGIEDPSGWLAEAADEIEAAMPDDGAPARTLTTLVPRLATRIVMGAGSNHQVEAGATSRVLGVLAAEGRLMRGRPAGEWTGRQYRWHTRTQWLGESMPPSVETDVASAALVRRWLWTFGPATYTDLKWWTGWPAGQVRGALGTVGAVEVDMDDGAGLALPDDLDDPPEPDPWVAVLPALDPTPMGWKERGWFLGDHAEPLFDRNGNIGPTLWADGRIVGGWGQAPDGEIRIGLLEDIGTTHRVLLGAEVDRLQRAIGDVVIKPSFPTPLQNQLRASP